MKKIIVITYLIVFCLLLINPIIAQAADNLFLLKDVPCATTGEKCNLCDFMRVFINASNIIVGLSGAFAVLMFVWGGILMITAYGSEARITQGKDVIKATVTGILLVFLGWTIVNFTIEALTGSHGIVSGPCG